MVYLKSVENVITLGKLICLLFLFCLPLLSISFLKTKRNDLARPVMGTIYLVYTVGMQYVVCCMSVVCQINCRNYVALSHAQSLFWAVKPVTPLLYARSLA